MIPSNQPPRSSGPPRTNVKGIYENSQSSIPVSTYLYNIIYNIHIQFTNIYYMYLCTNKQSNNLCFNRK